MTRTAGVLSSLTLALAATAGVAVAGPADPGAGVEPGPGEPGSMIPSGLTRGYVQPPPGTPPQVEHGSISKIIFVNRCVGGCTFTKSNPGFSDAVNNMTWLGSAPLGSTITISEFAHSEQVWQDTLECIRDVYSPYGVTVTDVDPSPASHHEAVLAGRGSELPIAGALGVAPLGGGQCSPANNVISFSFANAHTARPDLTLAQAMCWTVAQESAHSYGLDHEFDCSDPLTYLEGCGPKFFRNKTILCGTFAPEECVCGGTAQNSHVRLTAILGVGTLPPPPDVAISMPTEGATVQAGFSVFATAIDRRGVSRVELWINGFKWTEVEGVFGKTSPYVLDVPASVPEGVMDLDVKAFNDLEVVGTARVTVTRGTPCAGAEACAVGQKCDMGRCYWDPPTGEIGDACTYPQACLSNTCADVGGGSMACTTSCYGGPNDLCPAPFVCTAASGQQGLCGLPPDEGGCCSVGGQGQSRTALLVNLVLGALVGLVVIGRRRRRRA
jgi:hypothetical protein